MLGVRHNYKALTMNKQTYKITNDVQDRNSLAWKQLCSYIEELKESGAEEFAPLKILGRELYSEIYTLPESIGELKKVKKMSLYGSNLKRIPPEIGKMKSLENDSEQAIKEELGELLGAL